MSAILSPFRITLRPLTFRRGVGCLALKIYDEIVPLHPRLVSIGPRAYTPPPDERLSPIICARILIGPVEPDNTAIVEYAVISLHSQAVAQFR